MCYVALIIRIHGTDYFFNIKVLKMYVVKAAAWNRECWFENGLMRLLARWEDMMMMMMMIIDVDDDDRC